MKNSLLWLAALFVLSSCSYFAKKSCEEQNWYKLGYDLSQEGKRISSSDKVNECRKLDVVVNDAELDRGFKAGVASLCSKDTSYKNGKAGSPIQFLGFCGGRESTLRRIYEKGYGVFCKNQVKIAYDLGKKGRDSQAYEKCDEKIRKKITKAYDKGFRKYCLSKEKEAYTTGKAGNSFAAYEKCDQDIVNKLSAAHTRGIGEYCHPKAAYQIGIKGTAYKDVCPESKLKTFLSSYNKGRFIFLRGEVNKYKKQANDDERKANSLELSISKKKVELEKNQLKFERLQQTQKQYDWNRISIESSIRRLEKDLNKVKTRKAESEALAAKLQEEALNIGTGELSN